jgi:hypothetical protein
MTDLTADPLLSDVNPRQRPEEHRAMSVNTSKRGTRHG